MGNSDSCGFQIAVRIVLIGADINANCVKWDRYPLFSDVQNMGWRSTLGLKTGLKWAEVSLLHNYVSSDEYIGILRYPMCE